MQTVIKYYILDWNIASSTGKIVLQLDGEDPKVIENLDFETFTAIASVLARGNSKFDSTTRSVFNYKPL